MRRRQKFAEIANNVKQLKQSEEALLACKKMIDSIADLSAKRESELKINCENCINIISMNEVNKNGGCNGDTSNIKVKNSRRNKQN
jgi:hypothetical protein